MIKGVYKSDPQHEGVIFHYWEPLSNKCSAHLINTYLTNPLPSIPPPPLNPPSILPDPQSPSIQSYLPYIVLYYPPIILYRSLIILLSSYPSPLFVIILFPPIYTPILPHISPKTHTTFKLYLPLKRVFCHKMPTITHWQILKTII